MAIELKQTAVCGVSYTNEELVSLRTETNPRNFAKHVNLLTSAYKSRCGRSVFACLQHVIEQCSHFAGNLPSLLTTCKQTVAECLARQQMFGKGGNACCLLHSLNVGRAVNVCKLHYCRDQACSARQSDACRQRVSGYRWKPALTSRTCTKSAGSAMARNLPSLLNLRERTAPILPLNTARLLPGCLMSHTLVVVSCMHRRQGSVTM